MKKPQLVRWAAPLALSCLFCLAAEAGVLTVNTTNNVNPLPLVETSLWQALTNLRDGDTIQFNIPGNGPFYINTPTDGYPFITNNNVTIDGYSQPGSSPNTNSILASNNARIQIVLDSRDGPEQRTRLAPSNAPGFLDSESAILPVLGAKNFQIRGISFLSRHTIGTASDPEIYCIALINDATNARISGCWFGLGPDGATVAGGRSAVATFKGLNGASASGLVFGTDGEGQDDEAQFNISMGMGVAINLETPNVKVAGNFINVFPSGIRFPDLSALSILDGEGVEAIENGAGDNMIIGTDGDGKGDANERNIIGPVFYPARATYAWFWGEATNITFAGNYVRVGIDGQSAVVTNSLEQNISLIDIRSFSSIRIGSNFDGASDPLEGNLIYNLGCQGEQPCDPAGRAFIDLDDTNYENNGADAARIVMRGNTLVDNSCAVPVQDQNVTIANYYSSVLADSTNNFATTIATNSDGTRLLVTVPPPYTNNYSTVIVDFYAVDPVALSKNFVQGKSYLGSVVDGSELDLDPAPNRVAFHIGNLNLSGVATVAVMVTYSKDAGPATQSGRAVSAIYSNPLTVAPVAAPLSIGSFSYLGASIRLTVAGGAPPFQAQVRTNLTTGSWADLGGPFTNSPILLPAESGSQSFYRVTGQGHILTFNK